MTQPPGPQFGPGPQQFGQGPQQGPQFGYGPPQPGFQGVPQPGPYGYPQPKKTNVGLVVGLCVAGVLLLGGGGWWFWSETQTSPLLPLPSTPVEEPMSEDKAAALRAHAEKFIEALNADDRAGAERLTCGNFLNEHFVDAKPPLTLPEQPKKVTGSQLVFDVVVAPGRSAELRVQDASGPCIE